MNLVQAEQADADPGVQAYLARSNPPIVWAEFSKLGRDEQNKLLESTAARIPVNQIAAAARNAEQIRQPDWRLAALRGALARWSEAAPQDAAAFIAVLEIPSAMDALLRTWVLREPVAAAAWSASLKSCPGAVSTDALEVEAMAGIARVIGARVCREDAMRAAAFYWARRDPALAREWAARQQPQVLSRALQEMVSQAVRLANREH